MGITKDEYKNYSTHCNSLKQELDETIALIKAEEIPSGIYGKQLKNYLDKKGTRMKKAISEYQNGLHILAESFIGQDPTIREGYQIANNYS